MKRMKMTVWVAAFTSLIASFTHAEVQYLDTENNDQATYFVFKATAKSEALDFLRDRPVRDPLTYVVVETPQGNVARDCKSIFDESDGHTLESGSRPPLSVPEKSATHCYRCGCWVFPMLSPSTEGFTRVIQIFTLADLIEKSGGFTCPTCKLLMCAHCMNKPEAFDSEGKMTATCPGCSKPMNHYECSEDNAEFMLRYVSTHRREINERIKVTFGINKPAAIKPEGTEAVESAPVQTKLKWKEVKKDKGLIVAIPEGWEEQDNPSYILAPKDHRKLRVDMSFYYSPSSSVLLMGDGSTQISQEQIDDVNRKIWAGLDGCKLISNETISLADRYGALSWFEYNRGDYRFLSCRSTCFFSDTGYLVSAEMSGEISVMQKFPRKEVEAYLNCFRNK